MRKYLKILCGLIRLIREICLNLGSLKLHGISYCLCTGVKFWLHNGGVCDIGKRNWFSENCLLESNGGEILIGANNFFNSNCRIIALGNIIIGNNNLFGPNVVIVDHDHKFNDFNKLICKQGFNIKTINIGSNIWMGANVTVCSGITIVDNVVIGANSVVSRNILESGVYIGQPAIKVKELCK